ncbi:hypothetical protein PVIIG_05610 [Plasmodium vivax India VII]|uniref:Variable surface protein Vir4 n=1 Tax=Plasmodium vivax India VII TaxID=1077284 RepID=A0A0J9S502_PLAVI|nr:hypothetical protein PVIIG_05610 [Plasmodium vivax India VII]
MDMESDDLQDYHEECSKIKVKNKENEMIPICKKYLRFIDKSKSWGDVKYGYNVSLLLNYWIYKKLTEIYGDKNSQDIMLGFVDLQMRWRYFNKSRDKEPYYEKCKPDDELVNHTDWENRKALYDYCVNYDYLSMMANSLDKECEYYKKIQEKKSLYEHFESECLPPKNDCPNFFVQCEPYNPKYVLHKLHCHAEMQKAASETLGQSPGTRYTAEPNQGHEGDGGPFQFQAAGAVTQDTPSTSQPSDIKTKVANSVLGAAPVLFTGTMLYRYTPLGPWIRRFGGANTNSMSAMGGVSPYMQETGEMFSDNEANYISYQPM